MHYIVYLEPRLIIYNSKCSNNAMDTTNTLSSFRDKYVCYSILATIKPWKCFWNQIIKKLTLNVSGGSITTLSYERKETPLLNEKFSIASHPFRIPLFLKFLCFVLRCETVAAVCNAVSCYLIKEFSSNKSLSSIYLAWGCTKIQL